MSKLAWAMSAVANHHQQCACPALEALAAPPDVGDMGLLPRMGPLEGQLAAVVCLVQVTDRL